jgi:nitrogen regulatory protein PII
VHEVKRIEIVIGKPHVPQVRRVLEGLSVPGLTVFEAVEGFGDRGGRTGGELTDALVNHCLLTTCRTEQLDELAATLEPVLRRYGGLCLISDALVIRDDQA